MAAPHQVPIEDIEECFFRCEAPPLRNARRLLRDGVFIDRVTLHNDEKVPVWLCNKLDIFQRIAID
jgi:hypothetical protein